MPTLRLRVNHSGKHLVSSGCGVLVTWLLSSRQGGLFSALQPFPASGIGGGIEPIEPSEPQSIQLRSGLRIPRLGFGTGRPGGSRDPGVNWEDGRKRLVDAVIVAMQAGYRLIDTSLSSGMESAILEGVREAGVEEVCIATKLLQHAHSSPDAVRASLEDSLRNLQSDCIDMYLLQSPRGGNIRKVWAQLLSLRDEGLIRTLGVSNFGMQQLEGLRCSGLELPEVNQVGMSQTTCCLGSLV